MFVDGEFFAWEHCIEVGLLKTVGVSEGPKSSKPFVRLCVVQINQVSQHRFLGFWWVRLNSELCLTLLAVLPLNVLSVPFATVKPFLGLEESC
jgi:hypothetical protein